MLTSKPAGPVALGAAQARLVAPFTAIAQAGALRAAYFHMPEGVNVSVREFRLRVFPVSP